MPTRAPDGRKIIPDNGDPDMDYDAERWVSKEEAREMKRRRDDIHRVSVAGHSGEPPAQNYRHQCRVCMALGQPSMLNKLQMRSGVVAEVCDECVDVIADYTDNPKHAHLEPNKKASGQLPHYEGICIGGPKAGQIYCCVEPHFNSEDIPKDAELTSTDGNVLTINTFDVIKYEFMYLDGNPIWVPAGWSVTKARQVLIDSYRLHTFLKGEEK